MLWGYHIGRYIPRGWLHTEALRVGDPVPAERHPAQVHTAVASVAS